MFFIVVYCYVITYIYSLLFFNVISGAALIKNIIYNIYYIIIFLWSLGSYNIIIFFYNYYLNKK